MRVLFFFPSTGYYNRAISNPLGLLAIASYLKQHGQEVKIVDRNIERGSLNRIFAEFQPDIVGISVMSVRGMTDAMRISKAAKRHGLTVIWGGQMPSMQPELVLSCDYVDAVSYGEGELTWMDLLKAKECGEDFRTVPGMIFRSADGPGIEYSRERPFADLKDMAILDFTLIKTEKYLQPYLGCKRMIYLYSAKGCPGNCAFCPNTVFHKSTFRKRSIDNVIGEIKYLTEQFGVDGIYFSDELWCIKRDDLLAFCSALKENDIHIRWGIQLRIGMFNENDFQFLYDNGCRWVIFGIESGSTEIQKRIHKHLDFEKTRQTFEITDRIGLTTIASMIIGYPGETEEQLRDSVRLINSIKASMVPIYHFTPLPGTELYREVVESGAYHPPKTIKEMAKTIATESLGQNLSQVPDRDLKVIRSWYNWKAFSNKQAIISKKKFEFAFDTIVSGIRAISMKGPVSFLINGTAAFKEFIYTFWYAHAYPEIIKKYALNVENK